MPPSPNASSCTQRRLRGLLPLAVCGLLAACASVSPAGRQYHAFELGVAAEAGTVQHLRWRYGVLEVGSGEKPVAVGTGIPFMLHRDLMAVPEAFEASWQAADGVWRWACVPVRSRLQRGVEGHSLLFWVTRDGVRGEFVTYTPRGDQREAFTAATARAVDATTALRLRGSCTAAVAAQAVR